MTEAQFQSQYNIWKRHNYRKTCVEELKICNRPLFYLAQIEDHQLTFLNTVKHDFFQYKVPDLGMQNPFDSMSFYKEPAFVGILWYKPRQPKVFYMIDIDVIQGLIDDGKKSISEEQVKSLASFSGVLK